MNKIRKILERHAFTDTYYEPEEYIIFERDFDKLEKELQEYIDNEYLTIIWDARPFKAKVEFVYEKEDKEVKIHPFPMHSSYYERDGKVPDFDEMMAHGRYLEYTHHFEEVFECLRNAPRWKGVAFVEGVILNLADRIRKLEGYEER